jgi:hypothetical protein
VPYLSQPAFEGRGPSSQKKPAGCQPRRVFEAHVRVLIQALSAQTPPVERILPVRIRFRVAVVVRVNITSQYIDVIGQASRNRSHDPLKVDPRYAPLDLPKVGC